MHKNDIQVFEIPVYRITKSDFDEETDKLVRDAIGDNDVDEDGRRGIRNIYTYPYHYNEVVGWIRIFIDSIQVRGEYYFVAAKSIKRGFKKDYKRIGRAFEMATFKDEGSHEIYLNILKRLETLKNDRLFKSRFIDLESFENVGKYIDWRTLIDEDLKKPR